jgi:hypothetical protein
LKRSSAFIDINLLAFYVWIYERTLRAEIFHDQSENSPPERWRKARGLRLRALKTDLTAFGSTYEEEDILAEAEWQRRMKNTLFVMVNDKPVGTAACVFNDRIKTKHIARIFGM